MGIIASNSYLAVFASGTLIGASTVYLLSFFKTKSNKEEETPFEERFEERFEDAEGKVAAQCGHASVAAYAKALNQNPLALKRWMEFGGTKITVKIEDEAQLVELDGMAKKLNVMSSIIRDAGQTQVAPGSRTVIAIGPAPKTILDQITGHLKLY